MDEKRDVDQKISRQVLALATSELQRMETLNDSWRGAYSDMNVVDGDTIPQRLSGLLAVRKTIPRDFPKGYWIVYLQPSIPRFGRITIMAFSKDNLTLVYFRTANDNG